MIFIETVPAIDKNILLHKYPSQIVVLSPLLLLFFWIIPSGYRRYYLSCCLMQTRNRLTTFAWILSIVITLLCTVNDREFPVIFAPPYELDVSPALKAGKNRIELRLETSPRNTLGPFHTNETEPQSTSPGSFLTERDLLGWYPATDVPEYGVLEPSPEEITMS